VHLGYKSFLKGDYEAAVEELSVALQSIPNYEQARFIRGLAYAHLRVYDAAIDDFFYILQNTGIHKKSPTLPFHVNLDELYYLIGYAFFKQGDLVNAEYFYQTVTLKNPSFYMGHVQLARVYQLKKEYKKSLLQIDAALGIRSEDPIIHFHKGVVLSQMGEPTRALDEYKAALTLNPDYYKTHFNLAETLEGLGNKKGAINSYTAFLHRAPEREQDLISQAQRRLAQLRQAN
jgi:tetratricopeptide (TPR) repeat protein